MLKGWFSVNYQPEKQPKWDDLRKQLTNRNEPTKQAEALEQIVLLSFTESVPPHLLMPIIQYTATTMDHRVIKLLFLFLENIEIRDSRGEMRPEFILINDAIRKFLLSPNEYVRGAAIRFLYKINDHDILQQLLSAVISNLDHPDEYVRWYAAHLVARLARDIPGFDKDIADAITESFAHETNQKVVPAMLYAAFVASPKEALDQTINIQQFLSQDMKLAILQIASAAYQRFPQYRVRLLETVVDFTEDDSPLVRLQAANVLNTLSSSPSATRATATAYCELLSSLTDENQRAFVVQSLIELSEEHKDILAPLALEMSQGASIAGSLHQRFLNLLTSIVLKESAIPIVPLISSKDRDSLEALKTLLLRFPETCNVIANQVGPLITDSNPELSDLSSSLLKDCGVAGARQEAFKFFVTALDVSDRPVVLARSMWSVSEFAEDPTVGADILLDLLSSNSSQNPTNSTTTVINNDGTYTTKQTTASSGTLRQSLAEGSSFLGLALISSLVKAKLRGATIADLQGAVQKALGFKGVEKNAKDICNLWVKASEAPKLGRLFKQSLNDSFEHRRKRILDQKTEDIQIIPANVPLSFSVLMNTVEEAPQKTTKTVELPISQLTGPSDSLYVEASCTLRKYDRVYHITLYNRTDAVLTNILFEFTTVGSVSVLRRNDLLSLAPSGSTQFDLPVMISSGSCGTLFGAVSFDFAGAGGSDHQLLPLAPINIDPFFCFEPKKISDAAFRSKWAASVWERKIDIATSETDLVKYLDEIADNFKFAVITPREQLLVTSKNADFIAANLYTCSLFGEEVEMNISAKKGKDGVINGFLRIRSPDESLAYLFGKLIQ